MDIIINEWVQRSYPIVRCFIGVMIGMRDLRGGIRGA